MKRFSIAAGVAWALVFIASTAQAQVARSGYTLPVALAMEAAAEAIRACESNGYAVSASVLDVSGVVKLQAKGDHSTIHTRDVELSQSLHGCNARPDFPLRHVECICRTRRQEPGRAGYLIPAGYPAARRWRGDQGRR